MAIKSATRKRLWAISHNQCYICKKEVTEIKNGKDFVHGEMAHIISKKENGPRYKPMDDYDSTNNLMILCQKDHKLIDDQVENYSVSTLMNIKNKHENISKNIGKNSSSWKGYTTIKATKIEERMRGCLVFNPQIDEEIDMNKVARKFSDYMKSIIEWMEVEEHLNFEQLIELQNEINKLYENDLILISGVSNNFVSFDSNWIKEPVEMKIFNFYITKNKYKKL
ncbi:hypothetical protein [Mycoplasma todarodis]|uniref:HNH endonuclease n=1 Tax=Mycoplasma todarodis TaxID=1937191 RepID=A0A4V2NI56_9MOLU|nr:hypothetical protein [Mycoplasma todarodis]TCG11068.1 hypothetical protein C4B25_02365 [Mycoplasma todarodis]